MMFLKRCILVIVLTGCASFVKAQVPNSHLMAAEELVSTIQKDNYDNTINAVITMQSRAVPDAQRAAFQSAMKEFFARFFTWEDMRVIYARIYMGQFTEEELKAITAFYQTPAGKKLRDKTANLLTLSGAAGQQVVREHQAEFIEIMKRHVSTQH